MANRIYPYLKTAAPIVTDDTSAGYKVGDTWLDTTNDKIYQAIDVTASAAIWIEIVGRTQTQILTNKVIDPSYSGYKISVTVASNNLTVALKHVDGTDPSASRPMWFQINNNWRSLTSALSVTRNAGTNWFNSGGAELATKETDYFVYIIWNTTGTDAVDLGISRIPYGRLYSEFSSTSTNEKYIATGTTPTSTDDFRVIGRFAATLSAGAGYTWSVPSFTNSNLINEPIYETRILTFSSTWTSSTPPAIGDGTNVGSYQIRGRKLHVFERIVAGSTTTFGSGVYTWSLPFTALTVSNIGWNGYGFVYDSSTTTRYIGSAGVASGATTMNLSTHGSSSDVSATVPVTLASSDIIQLVAEYPIA